ncbi:YhcB family protein, partial [Thalassospira xiamenensis]
MDMLTTNLISFAVGLVLGAGLLYWLLPARRQSSRVLRDRDDARQALNHYRDQVDHHFLRTAELVNELTNAY